MTESCTLKVHGLQQYDGDPGFEIWAVPQCTTGNGEAIALVDAQQQLQGFLLPPQSLLDRSGEWTGYARTALDKLTPLLITPGR